MYTFLIAQDYSGFSYRHFYNDLNSYLKLTRLRIKPKLYVHKFSIGTAIVFKENLSCFKNSDNLVSINLFKILSTNIVCDVITHIK